MNNYKLLLVHGLREMKQYVGDLFQQHKKKRKVLAKTLSFTSAIAFLCLRSALFKCIPTCT